MVGKKILHYRILDKIGAGAMGEVYRAHDERLDRDIAVKVLAPGTLVDEAARKRFRKEAQALSRLNHPNIQSIIDFHTEDGVDFLLVEYIPGCTLSDRLAKGPLLEKEAVRLATQLVQGLGAAHAQGVIHRDLKPGNLRVTPDNRLKILDFGLAKMLRPVTPKSASTTLSEVSLDSEGAVGTLPYMSPEQLRGEPADGRSDLYAAGAVFCEMVTGRRPFPETQGSRLIDDILHRPPVPPRALNPRVSVDFERIILKCLEKDPEHRYASAKDAEVDLRRLGGPLTTASQRESSSKRPSWRILTPAAAILTLVLLLAILIAAVWGIWRDRLLSRAGPPRIESLAVLPLKNYSSDPNEQYFADGMTEELTATLAKVSTLRVISRTSAMQYKETHESVPQIARKLHVDAVIEGSVLRQGDHVRITAQLIWAPKDKHLWAADYEGDIRNILTLQSEVAEAIANEVRVQLTPQDQARLAIHPQVDPQSHVAYLKGRYYLSLGKPEEGQKVIDSFNEALKLDPNSALAYAGLADVYNLYGRNQLAQDYATKALKIDDNLAEAHVTLGRLKQETEMDFSGAAAEFQRALSLNPNDADAHVAYATYLADVGRLQEAVREAEQACELDPITPMVTSTAALVDYLAGQYDASTQRSLATLQLTPNFSNAHAVLGVAYEQKGKYPQAITELRKAIEISPGTPIFEASLGHAYGEIGNRPAAEEILRRFDEISKRGLKVSYFKGLVYMGMGEKAQALDNLEQAYSAHEGFLRDLRADPRFAPLRSDPRFRDLVRRVGLLP